MPASLINDRSAETAPPQPANHHPLHHEPLHHEPLYNRAPFLLYSLYALTGFTGLLAEQGFERYIGLLVGATASASAVVLFTYFLGFALGGGASPQRQTNRPPAAGVRAHRTADRCFLRGVLLF